MSRFSNLEFDGGVEKRATTAAQAKDAAHYLGLADAAFAEGEFEVALRHYAKVLEYNPGEIAAWAGQVRMLIELGDFMEAKSWADKALERFPRSAELLAAKAVLLGRSGDEEAALTFSDAAMEEQGDVPYVWLARGDVLLARKEKNAAYCFEKALLLAKGDWVIAWLAARIHYFHEQFALALKYAQEALSREAGRAAVWLQLGRCQLALGLEAVAGNAFEQARQINPQCAEARLALQQLAERGAGERLQSWWRRLFNK